MQIAGRTTAVGSHRRKAVAILSKAVDFFFNFKTKSLYNKGYV